LRSFEVSGHSFRPEGEIKNFKEEDIQGISQFLKCASISNDSKLIFNEKKAYAIKGVPTEAALRVLVEKIGNYDKSVP